MKHPKFWPLDYDPEGAIYENVAWDLPGFRKAPRQVSRPRNRTGRKRSLR
jgi:hypothetical protein